MGRSEDGKRQMGTSNTNNTGIFHAVHKFGGATLCKRRNAIMAVEVAKFRTLDPSHQCKRCAAKLADMEQNGARKLVGTIDPTPTWASALPLYLAAIVDGSASAKAAAREELTRMARLADIVRAGA